MLSKPRIFISYARADGEAFATALRRRLETEQPELTLWQDRAEMEGGKGWWNQILDALNQVEFLVLVMTPAAITSEYTRKEWQFARQQGVCVYPVKAIAEEGINYDLLPRWMQKAHFFDLDAEWDTFVRYLKSPCQATRVPFMAPELPRCYVHRPAEFTQLLDQLQEHDTSIPLTITTALRGAGGFGKTTLAAALCHDERVITVFEDGILWVTLGEKPNLLHALIKLYAALTDERPNFVDSEEASIRLGEKLTEKHCLLVLDDVWNATDLEPFLRGGPETLRLLTTRNFEIGSRGRCINVDEMTQSESLQILTTRLSLTPSQLLVAQQLVRRLGEWPLLLSLAGAALQYRVKRGESVNGALAYLKRALDERGVTAFDQRNPTQREHAIATTIDVSLDLLSPDERARFLALSIFPEDTDVPLATIATLWDLGAFDTEVLVQSLDTFSLLKFHLPGETVRLHDVMRAYLATQVADAASLHASLLDHWGDLERLPNPYAWRWLGYHLLAANRSHQLKTLLCDADWLQAKLDATDVSSLLADFDWFPRDSDLESLRLAIRQSAVILWKDKHQLVPQLKWRLTSDESADIRGLLGGISSGPRILRGFQNASPTPPLIRTWKGHDDAVNTLAITADGSRIVSASTDRTVKVWDLHTGAELHCFLGHRDWISCVIVSPDGIRAFSGSADGNIIEWHLDSGFQVQTFKGHSGWITALALCGNRLASAASDGTLKFWDSETGRELGSFPQGKAGVTAMVFSKDAKTLLISSSDGRLTLVACGNGREVGNLSGHAAGVTELSTTRTGLAISASVDGSIKIWNFEERRLIHTLLGHTAAVSSIAASADGRRLASCAGDKTIILWDLDSGHAIQRLCLQRESPDPVEVQFTSEQKPYSKDLTPSAQQGNGAVIGSWACHTGWLSAFTITPDGRRLISGAVDGSMKLWDIQWMAEQMSLQIDWRFGTSREAPAVAISSDGKAVLTATISEGRRQSYLKKAAEVSGSKTSLELWTSDPSPEGELSVRLGTFGSDESLRLFRVRSIECGNEDISRIAISADRRTAVCVSADGNLRLWDLRTGSSLGLADHKITSVNPALTTTPDNALFVVGDRHDVKIGDLKTGEIVRSINTGSSALAVASSIEGKRIMVLCSDGNLAVWDNERKRVLLGARFMDSNESVLQLDTPVHWLGGVFQDNRLGTVSITPDGKVGLSAHSGSPAISVWDLDRGSIMGVLVGDERGISAVSISSNGQRAHSLSTDGSLAVWDLEAHERIGLFCVRASLRCSVLASEDPCMISAQGIGGAFLFRAWEIWPQ